MLKKYRIMIDIFKCNFFSDTSYEKACGSDRRGSAPATPILGGRHHQSPPLRNDVTNSPTNGGANTPTQNRLAVSVLTDK